MSKTMCLGMGNPVVMSEMHYEWRPSWIFNMAALNIKKCYILCFKGHTDMILVSKLMFSDTGNPMVTIKEVCTQQLSWIFNMIGTKVAKMCILGTKSYKTMLLVSA